ncbi:MAG: alpha/beta hydrolase [Coriobacteriales bacterium]|nr:alpha/beta hydrolase [Coriobacteriales bacterium]
MNTLKLLAGRRALTIAGAAVAVPATALLGFSAVSHGIYHRSNLSTLSEIYHRFTSNRHRLADPIAFDNYVLEQASANDQPVDIPEVVPFKTSVESIEIGSTQTFLLNRRDRNDRAVIYVHGGSFLRRPNVYQWKFADILARRTRAEIFMPMYPLAPNNTHAEAYASLEEVYHWVVDEYGARNVTLMGDGAGGGLAVSFAQHISDLGWEQPSHLILVSPWVDMTLGNPRVDEFEAHDPLLAPHGLRKVGALWARGVDACDPLVSAVNGEVRNLRNVMVFAGTREILYPDAKLLYDRIAATGIHAEFHEGRGLNHNYPLYPTPEASKAMEAIVSAVTED